MKYLIILALIGSIGCGKVQFNCERTEETLDLDKNCNEEDSFCAKIKTTKEKCKEVDLNILGI